MFISELKYSYYQCSWCWYIFFQINEAYNRMPGKFVFNSNSAWWRTLRAKVKANQESVQVNVDCRFSSKFKFR